MILCVVGPSCAGKTTIAEYLSDHCDVHYVEASDFVKRRYNDTCAEEDLLNFVQRLFEHEGKDVVVKDIISDIDIYSKERTVISGFRTVEEVDFLRSKFENVHCLGVYANSETRFNRNLRRDGEEAIQDYRKFLNKDFVEYSFGISSLLQNKAESLIVNEGSFEELYTEVDDAIISPFFED